MSHVISGWKRLSPKQSWAGRGASIVAKVKATKAVWFPPSPVKSGKQTASTAARKTARRTTGTSAAAVKKSTGSARKVAGPVRRKKA